MKRREIYKWILPLLLPLLFENSGILSDFGNQAILKNTHLKNGLVMRFLLINYND